MLSTHATLLLAAALSLASGCKTSSDTTRAGAAAPATQTPAPAADAQDTPHDSVTDAADHGRIRGSASAPLWIVEVSDFQCPFCKEWHDATYPAIDSEYVRTGKVRLAYINLPLNIHRWSKPAAEAAMCASAQGKFWPMHDSLFVTQGQWEQSSDPEPQFQALAAKVGVNVARWRQCTSSHEMLPLIEADADRAAAAGAQSTPTFFIGNQKLEGAQPLSIFRQVIDRQLAAAASKGPASAPPAR